MIYEPNNGQCGIKFIATDPESGRKILRTVAQYSAITGKSQQRILAHLKIENRRIKAGKGRLHSPEEIAGFVPYENHQLTHHERAKVDKSKIRLDHVIDSFIYSGRGCGSQETRLE